MLELICHQHYTWDGVPADKSPYRNHGSGINTGGSADGAEPGSGVITFPQPHSRVRIATGPAWQPLTALKIEVLARVDPTGEAPADAGRRSRLLPLRPDGRGAGGAISTMPAAATIMSGALTILRRTTQYHPVPANKWVRLGFHHDGFAKMRLFLDGELVGEAVIEGSIPPVQNLGVVDRQ